ncbi:hypothetical protein BO86DRAFT_69489 [Aspergillus japonicus CBS 114.51]|uniref:Uncharacterized protein n=2 Tax=Aspergillus TaxID=5052 RepID=A0A2V5H6Q8_ASPV1|nr:hypothetical protein BO86DRAFT_69489 [Aspergillus japonicus CBS 114.51]PYI19221.1 hypothetical protein BO99DRAFT_402840 [Aspergillus violaceofuscus CBS 115571]RAH82501.1 hypothetical protein BO86DRAFT_69489 [Aspergillus japonicus CBS 114.51]
MNEPVMRVFSSALECFPCGIIIITSITSITFHLTSLTIIQVDSIVQPPLLLGRILGNRQLGLGFIPSKPTVLHYR